MGCVTDRMNLRPEQGIELLLGERLMAASPHGAVLSDGRPRGPVAGQSTRAPHAALPSPAPRTGNAGPARRLQVAQQLLEPSISYPPPVDADLIPHLGEAIDILVSNDFVCG